MKIKFLVMLFLSMLFMSDILLYGEESSNSESWINYSTGIFIKDSALKKKDLKERKILLDKAIVKFKISLKSRRDTHRVYFEIAESYFYKNNFSESEKYSKKSIKSDKRFLKPYTLLYRIYISQKKFKESTEILKEFLITDPDNIRQRFILAEHYLKYLKDQRNAKKEFSNVVELSKKIVRTYYREKANYYLGYIAFKEKNIKKCIYYLENVYSINPNNYNAIYLLAIQNMNEYKLKGAKKYSLLYLKRYPWNKYINFILGRVEYIQDSPEAIYSLSKLKKSRSIDGFLAKGLYNEILKKDYNAEIILKKVLKLNPNYISAHIALGKIYKRKNNIKNAFNEFMTTGVLLNKKNAFNESWKYLKEAEKLNQKVPEIYFYMAWAQEEKKNYSMAIFNYHKLMKINKSQNVVLRIGYLYSLKKEFDKALEFFDMAQKSYPKSAKPYFFKGLNYLWSEKFDKSEENILKAISIKNDSEKYYFYLAVVQEKKKNINQAIKSIKKAIDLNPRSARAYNYLGYMYADYNINLNDSESLIKKALNLDPGNGAYIDSLGWFYFRKGRYKEALKTLLKAEKKLNIKKIEDSVVLDHIGDTYKMMKNSVGAKKYWKKSYKLKKDEKVKSKLNSLEK